MMQDAVEPRMDTNRHELSAPLLLKEEVFKIVGCAMDVLNGLGHGLLEKPYENAMVIEFRARGIPYAQQRKYQIKYKEEVVGEYIPDLLAFDGIVVDIKTVNGITPHERGQMINYLKITGCKVGIILNFKKAKLEWERIIL